MITKYLIYPSSSSGGSEGSIVSGGSNGSDDSIGSGAFTVKLTVKLCGIIWLPLTVTVALYVPAGSPFIGTIVKISVPYSMTLLIVVLFSEKL